MVKRVGGEILLTIYEDISIILSAISTGVSVIQLIIAFNGNSTHNRQKEVKIPNIRIAQFLLYFAGFIVLLPIAISLILHNQTGQLNSENFGAYKFNANELFRMAWGVFLVIVGVGLNKYKH